MQVPSVAIVIANKGSKSPIELIPDNDKEGDAGTKTVHGDDCGSCSPAPNTSNGKHHLFTRITLTTCKYRR